MPYHSACSSLYEIDFLVPRPAPEEHFALPFQAVIVDGKVLSGAAVAGSGKIASEHREPGDYTDALTVKISGSGNVTYYGAPSELHGSVTGSGAIVRK
ncbi:MAG: hypothetical protein JXR37_27575 [Kiritimatiellae bacterium]|nr:hypothetical protein [Kiritimatiellia bacterium]